MAAKNRPIVAFVLIVGCSLVGSSKGAQYLGKFLGKLTEYHHGVSGEVYAVDGRTLHIKDFTYDGQAPAAYFLAGSAGTPSKEGFRIPDENGNSGKLRRYRKEPVTITLPEGKTLRDIKWFSVWCEEFEVNFGDIKIPRNFDYPRPQKIDPLKGVHAIASDNVVVVDAQTLLVPNLSYDGEAPDAKFWVGRGPKPSPQGIRVPDENGKELPLRRYDRKTVVLTLPGDLTVFDIGHFGIWCEAFTVDFGHIQIPQNVNVPPSLKMLGVSPQSKLNCEVLYDDLAFEVRWAVAGDSIILQLVAKLDQREYMSFGISGELEKTVMVGGDVVVAWVDKETLKGYAVDYFLDAKSQCSGPKGSCPDENIQPNTNNIRLLNAAMVNGYSIITYQRPLQASDGLDKTIFTNRSQAIIWGIGPLNQRDEVSFHTHYTKGNRFIDFGRTSKWNCPLPETDTSASMKAALEEKRAENIRSSTTTTTTTTTTTVKPRSSERRRGDSRGTRRQPQQQQQQTEIVRDSEDSASQPARARHQSGRRGVSTTPKPVPTPAPVKSRDPWVIPPIQCDEPEDGVFYAQMGPTGGKHGYPAITGHVGWGISWYINGLLIPEIYLVRGRTYTFVVEGGVDPDIPAKYHPFYITDDPVGGYEYKTDEEKKNVTIFAGVRRAKDGKAYPSGVGRLCHWTQQGDKDADDFPSFGAYQRTLELICDQGDPGFIQWTPDANTPDTVYYQCFTHRYLGWKIHIVDSCDGQTAASELHPVIVQPNAALEEKDELATGEGDLEESPSIIVETRVKPNDITDNSKKIIIVEEEEATLQENKKSWGNPQGYSVTENDNTNFFYQNKNNFKASPVLEVNNEQDISTTIAPTTTTSTTTTIKPITENKTEDTEPLNKQDTVELPMMTLPQKEIYGYNKIIMRRPTQSVPLIMQNKPHIFQQPTKTMLRPVNVMHPRPFQMKKPYYTRPIYKAPALTRPVRMPLPVIEERPVFVQNMIKPQSFRPQSFILMKPQVTSLNEYMLFNQAPQQFVRPSTEEPLVEEASQITPTAPTITHIEISPQQASTEKEPDLDNSKSYAPLLSIKPSPATYKLPPARNTGFRPESVVIEGGFKPIVSKEIQDRKDENVDNGPEIENESEIGVINVSTEKDMDKSPTVVETFEPMFVPSPLDKYTELKPTKMRKRANTKKNQVVFIIKQSRSVDGDETLSDDEIAEAAERVDSYYLPPPDKELKRSQLSLKPSDIDISPGTVVTYDGKKVSTASLTMKYPDRATASETRVSKAAELIRSSPQFVPFKGDLPPLDPKFVNTDVPQLKSRGGLSRDLDAPSAPTRLSLVRQLEENIERRKKREAHHTPEHTAEQNLARQKQNETVKSSASSIGTVSSFAFLLICLVTLF